MFSFCNCVFVLLLESVFLMIPLAHSIGNYLEVTDTVESLNSVGSCNKTEKHSSRWNIKHGRQLVTLRINK